MNTINTSTRYQPILYGVLATTILFLVYASLVTLISGFPFMVDQLSAFWYFIVSLAIGFVGKCVSDTHRASNGRQIIQTNKNEKEF